VKIFEYCGKFCNPNCHAMGLCLFEEDQPKLDPLFPLEWVFRP
jgi:hypothetical protein